MKTVFVDHVENFGFLFLGALMDTTNQKSYHNSGKEEVNKEEPTYVPIQEPRQFIVQM